jgi:homoserine O-succinyltransferase
VELELMRTDTHEATHVSKDHMLTFYKTFSEIKDRTFDGMVITGAPVEHLAFEEVNYWEELKEIMEFTKTNVTSTMHICWGALAGLYYHYGIPTLRLPEKRFGIYWHKVLHRKVPLMRGFDDVFLAPHSRHVETSKADILKNENLTILAESDVAGPLVVVAQEGKQIFITGHPEYDRNTLDIEYRRDLDKGLDIQIPYNYYPEDDPEQKPLLTWRAHANAFYTNWLNYYVYQQTPYEL